MTLKIDANQKVVDLLTEYVKLNIKSIPLDRFGNQSYHDFDSQQLPNKNVDKGFFSSTDSFTYFKHYHNSHALIEKCNAILKAKENTNCLVYYPNSFMHWHTNSDNPGIRTYYTYSLGYSLFRYIDNDNIIDDVDSVGWTVRQFAVDIKKPLWHTIWSSGFRFSFGFNT